MVGVIWYRFVRCGGTDSSATVVPIEAIRWYRFIRYSGTDSPILSVRIIMNKALSLPHGTNKTTSCDPSRRTYRQL